MTPDVLGVEATDAAIEPAAARLAVVPAAAIILVRLLM